MNILAIIPGMPSSQEVYRGRLGTLVLGVGLRASASCWWDSPKVGGHVLHCSENEGSFCFGLYRATFAFLKDRGNNWGFMFHDPRWCYL